MKCYDNWITEGDDITCTECGYVYTQADGGCDPCMIWTEQTCETIYQIAESIKDYQLMDFLNDFRAASEHLNTRDKWSQLLEETSEKQRKLRQDQKTFIERGGDDV